MTTNKHVEVDEVTQENCRDFLVAYMEKEKISAPRISNAIGCSHATIGRLLAGITTPTVEFITQAGVMMELGIKQYAKLTENEKCCEIFHLMDA